MPHKKREYVHQCRELLTFVYKPNCQVSTRTCEILSREPCVAVQELSPRKLLLREHIPIFCVRGFLPNKKAFGRVLDRRKEFDMKLVAEQGDWLAGADMHAAVWPHVKNVKEWEESICSIPDFARFVRQMRAAA